MTQKSILDRAYLKTPCSTEWGLMDGSEQIRFCSRCNKQVYNLSSMTRKEVEDLIAEAGGGLCAKFERDDRGNIITSDHLERPFSMRIHLPRFTSAAVATLLGFGIVAPEISASPNRVVAACRAPSEPSVANTQVQSGEATLSGTVFDANKAVIVTARVTLISENSGQKQNVASSEEGQYRFEKLKPATYTIKIESPGFVSFKKTGVELRADQRLRMDVILKVGTVGGLAILPDTDRSSTILRLVSSSIRAVKKSLVMKKTRA